MDNRKSFLDDYVQHWLLFKKYTSIKQLVHIHLVNFLSVYTKDEEVLWMKSAKVPLYQSTDGKKILYICPVVLQLFPSDHGKVRDIVNVIAAHLLDVGGELFNIKIIPPDSIHIEITDSTLAHWLHELTVKNTRLERCIDWGDKEMGKWGDGGNHNNQLFKIKLFQVQLFKIQYAHARCCSLLRLADREGLIKLINNIDNRDNIDNRVGVKGLLSTQPIPWLDCDQKLRLHQPDEMRLIHLLVKLVDDLVFSNSHSSVNWTTAALKLSEAFEGFWCNCRIWGEVKINSLELAQARLGLLIATQLVLRSILETKLRVVALGEL